MEILGAKGKHHTSVSPQTENILREDRVTQGEPGDWEISVLITDFYSLASKTFQLTSRF